jgi:hypothetical protein
MRISDLYESKKIIGTNCENCVFAKHDIKKPVDKSELNEYGGLKPPNKEYITMSKRVDLITLPGKEKVTEKFWCENDQVYDYVTKRMCCALWDATGVKRDYKGESPIFKDKK